MPKRVFISFAIEDQWARDYLRGQARNANSPFEFVDMSVKEPWDNAWKTRCRTRIRGCDGMIILVSKNSRNAAGQGWEINCGHEEAVPSRPIYVSSEDRPKLLPPELAGRRIYNWTWDNLANFIDSL